MLTREKNELLTRIGPDAPAGAVMRRYWQPAALVEEIRDDRPVLPVTLLGESLVLFRDEAGRYGLMQRNCPHRGVDLCFGRLEDGGLRCAFHGWLFDVAGRCIDQPAEPPARRFGDKVRTRAYPCVERAGIIWAYMGPGTPPELPALDCFVAPASHVFAFKGLWACNWLQALEVGIDPAHTSFLHRFFEDKNPAESYGRQFRDRAAADSDLPMTRLLRDQDCPEIEVDRTDYGLRIRAMRALPDGSTHVRVTNQLFPSAICIPISTTMTITQWHVPVDDVRTYWYSIFTSFDGPVDRAAMRTERVETLDLPDYAPRNNAANNYGYDPENQRRSTYTGLGNDVNLHDQWAVESPGAIFDRTQENLGNSDRAIAHFRLLWEKAIRAVQAGDDSLPLREAGVDTAHYVGPATIDALLPAGTPVQSWQTFEAARRAATVWTD